MQSELAWKNMSIAEAADARVRMVVRKYMLDGYVKLVDDDCW